MPRRSSRGCDTRDPFPGGRIDSGVASVITQCTLERHDDAPVTRRSHARLRSSMTIATLAPLYAWVKALHVVSMVAWMAGMLSLPQVYAYHCDVRPDLRRMSGSS
jgi:hypothetical protein